MLFLELLVHHQSRMVWDWFTSETYGELLKEFNRPLYYVAASMAGKEAKEELLKAAPEIEESIEQGLWMVQ